MSMPGAVEAALGLMRMPALAPAMRAQPVPSDVLVVIRIAAGSDEAVLDAAQTFPVSIRELREAASTYLQQVIVHPGADPHRTLGLNPGASAEQVKEHKRWLLKWLHPDRNRNSWEALLFQRVVESGQELDRREQALMALAAPPSPRRSAPADGRMRWVANRNKTTAPRRVSLGLYQAAALSLVVVCAALVLLYARTQMPAGLAEASPPGVPAATECLPGLPCPGATTEAMSAPATQWP